MTNTDSTQEGKDRFTNSELAELYLLAVGSRQLSVPGGSEFYARDNFANVSDVHDVYGTDPLLTRAGTDAGAVDAFVIGSEELTATDQIPFLGVGQKLVVSNPPMTRVDAVRLVSSGHVYEDGADYEVVPDASGVSGSVRARDGIRFLPTANPMPTLGALVSVDYAYNQLVRDLQASNDDRNVNVFGSDLLYRLGTNVSIFLSANLTVKSNFVVGDIQKLVSQAIQDTINGLGLGDAVETFDIETAVGRISGVGNFVITNIARSSTGVGTTDIPIAGNEKATIDPINLTINPV